MRIGCSKVVSKVTFFTAIRCVFVPTIVNSLPSISTKVPQKIGRSVSVDVAYTVKSINSFNCSPSIKMLVSS